MQYKKKKRIIIGVVVVIIFILIVGWRSASQSRQKEAIRLATTTSTENSGLLEYILPEFIEKYNREVKVIAVGSGKAFQMGKDKEADVLLVHDRAGEDAFVEQGFGQGRYDVMYNDFVLVGPMDDGLIRQDEQRDILLGFKKIYQEEKAFISRGDDSGTHRKELRLWSAVEIEPESGNYISVGKGMGETLIMADEQLAYTLTDRASYLAMQEELDIGIVIENDALLFNPYGIIPVSAEGADWINQEGGQEFIDWICSDEIQEKIGQYGVEEFGQALFIPNHQ